MRNIIAGATLLLASSAAMAEEDLTAKAAMEPISIAALTAEGSSFTLSPVVKNVDTNVAIGGYDPVAYFVDGAPQQGDEAYTLNYQGATFQFISKENRQAFEDNPERFAPQYGGYCVKAVAEGEIVAGDPLFWRLESDRLYFTRSAQQLNEFDTDPRGTISQAQNAWGAVDQLGDQYGLQ